MLILVRLVEISINFTNTEKTAASRGSSRGRRPRRSAFLASSASLLPINLAPRYLVRVRALVTGIRHFFMILCALCASAILFRIPPGLIIPRPTTIQRRACFLPRSARLLAINLVFFLKRRMLQATALPGIPDDSILQAAQLEPGRDLQPRRELKISIQWSRNLTHPYLHLDLSQPHGIEQLLRLLKA